MNQSPLPPLDPGQWIEDIKVGSQRRNDAWKAVYLHWHDHLIAPALKMGLSRTEADDALAQMQARVNHLANVGRWQMSSGRFLLEDLCLSVADEVVVWLFQKKEADADQRAVAYIQQHWQQQMVAHISRNPQEAQAVFEAGVERMRQRVLSPTSLFALQEWHMLKHLQDEILLAAVELGGITEKLALEYILKTWLGNQSKVALYVLNNKGSEADAEDVCMVTLTKIYNKVISNTGLFLYKTLESYLYTVGKNYWKGPVMPPPPPPPSGGHGDLVMDCAENLKDEDLRETYLLHLEGYSNEQIAERLKIAKRTVLNRKVIAKDLVEECLCIQTLKEPLEAIYQLHKSGKDDKYIASTQQNLSEQDVAKLRVAAELLVGQCLERARKPKNAA